MKEPKNWEDEWKFPYPLTRRLKSFIRNLLAAKDHDHEILVNTILDTKNAEIKAKEETITHLKELLVTLKR